MTFVRNFAIAFLIAFAILLPAVYFGVGYVINTINESLAGEVDTENGDENTATDDENFPDSTGTVSMLLVGTMPYSDSLSTSMIEPGSGDSLWNEFALRHKTEIVFMTIVSVNCDKHQVMITALPGNIRVNVKGVDMSLSDGYYYMQTGKYGLSKDYLAEAVTGVTGVPIDVYATINLQSFVKIADKMGGISAELSDPLIITGKNEATYPAGVNVLSSDDLQKILTYNKYTSPYPQMQVLTSICRAVLDRYCTEEEHGNKDEHIANMTAEFSSLNLGKYNSINDFWDKVYTYRYCTVNQVNSVGNYQDVHGYRLFCIDTDRTVVLLKQYS